MNHRSNLGISGRAMFFLIYLLPIAGSLLFLFFDWKDREIRLHCLQMLYLALAVVGIHLLLSLLAMIPLLGAFFRVLIWVLYLIYAIILLVGLARAWNDSILKVPGFFDAASRGSF